MNSILRNSLLALYGLAFSVTGHALTIVQMQTRLAGTTADIYLELYEDIAPINVNNFLGYVDRGDYDDSFFHRQAFDFVIQGGGFTYIPEFDHDARFYAPFGETNLVEFADPVTGELGLRPIDEPYVVDANGDDIPDEDASGEIITRVNDGLKAIPSMAPVTNEFNLSNLRGTIAMAKLAGDPDSATSQWFVNLGDNSANLDFQNGGFTVIGRVMGAGMDFFDAVNALDIKAFASNVHPELGNLPVANYEQFTLVLEENLVKISSARRLLKIDVTSHDFGYVNVGNMEQVLITITNQSSSSIEISKIGDADVLAAPFAASDDCVVAAIAPGNTCTITVTFMPTLVGYYQDSFDITFNSPSVPNVSVSVDGTSILEPRISSLPESSLDFDYIYPGQSRTRSIIIKNVGSQQLSINDVSIDSLTDYSQVNDCLSLDYNKDTCEIEVTFSPDSLGTKTATLTINGNDPLSPYMITLTGISSDTTVPDISVEPEYDFGDLQFGQERTETIDIKNIGTTVLDLSSVDFGGDDVSEFYGSNNCGLSLAVNESCSLFVTFRPLSIGNKSATLTVNSNDPDNPSFVVLLRGTSSSDADNISDDEENGGPNEGDANNDGIIDSIQNNVVSLRTGNNEYMSIVVAGVYNITDTEIVEFDSMSEPPAGYVFEHELVSYRLSTSLAIVNDLGNLEVGIFMPASNQPVSFYQYGPTTDNPTPHWYEFMFDGETGAQIFPNVTVTAPDGRQVSRDFIRVVYADGKRGDNDLAVDGVVTVTAGAASQPVSSGSGNGALNLYIYFAIILLLLTGRVVSNNKLKTFIFRK